MKIAFDVSPIYDRNRFRGIGIYTKKLFDNLQKIDKKNIYISFTRGDPIPKCDLIHYPYFDPFFLTLPLFKKYPTVVTIHDMIPFVFPDQFPRGAKGEIKWQIQKLSLKSVKAVITDSQCSKRDIVRFVGIDDKKVHVIYLAPSVVNVDVDDKTKIEVKRKFELPSRFLLYIGDINYNKNIPRLFEAIGLLGGANDISLVLVGQAFIDKNLKEKTELDLIAKKFKIDNKLIKIGVVSKDDLVVLYKLTSAYIHPSLYEGFGIPVLDAMFLGCPAITSTMGSLKEITDDSAILVNPLSSRSIADGVEKLLHYDTAQYHSMIEKGKENATRFTWENTVKKTIAVYEKAVGLSNI